VTHDPGAARGRRADRPARVRLASDLAVEHFEDSSVVLLAMRDRWITGNRFLGRLLDVVISALGGRDFSADDGARLLEQRFGLTPDEAREEIEAVFSLWRGQGILEEAGDSPEAQAKP
jgi:hypothetical protein